MATGDAALKRDYVPGVSDAIEPHRRANIADNVYEYSHGQHNDTVSLWLAAFW